MLGTVSGIWDICPLLLSSSFQKLPGLELRDGFRFHLGNRQVAFSPWVYFAVKSYDLILDSSILFTEVGLTVQSLGIKNSIWGVCEKGDLRRMFSKWSFTPLPPTPAQDMNASWDFTFARES